MSASAKSNFYPVFAAVSRGQWAHTLFSTPDDTWHRNTRRAMSGAFTQTTVITFEPLMDSTIRHFLDELESRFANEDDQDFGKPFDAFRWISYFAFDNMSDMTYSERHGFISKDEDIHGIMGWVQNFLDYGTLVGKDDALFPYIYERIYH